MQRILALQTPAQAQAAELMTNPDFDWHCDPIAHNIRPNSTGE
jgi:hypothetical protein